ncbi:MAG: dihydroorotase [Gemmatimonadaceae bacterium]
MSHVMGRDLVLKGGRIVDPSQQMDVVGDVLVRGGVIESCGPSIGIPEGAEVVDCAGMVIAPGFIDVHIHLREPGREDVETVATGAHAAVAGGFTGVCAMPNTKPVTDNQATVGFVKRQGEAAGFARVYPYGAISLGQKGETLAEIGEMVSAGAVAFSDDGKPVESAHLMRTALEYARTFNVPVAEHCEDMSLARGGAMNEGLMSAKLGLKGIPAEAEEIYVIRDILLARLTGGHIHLCHLSTKGSVELVRWGKERGINVTAEVCSHHISLTEDAVDGYNTNAKMNPPLRTAADIEALQQGLADGTIDLLVTDHAPHHYDEKEREFADAPNGIVGLETALGVNCTYLLHRGVLSLSQMIDAMSCKPAKVFHLPGGSLARGSLGDVSIFDPNRRWSCDPATFKSKGRNTPYGGHEFTGQARVTVVGGRVVYRAAD